MVLSSATYWGSQRENASLSWAQQCKSVLVADESALFLLGKGCSFPVAVRIEFKGLPQVGAVPGSGGPATWAGGRGYRSWGWRKPWRQDRRLRLRTGSGYTYQHGRADHSSVHCAKAMLLQLKKPDHLSGVTICIHRSSSSILEQVHTASCSQRLIGLPDGRGSWVRTLAYRFHLLLQHRPVRSGPLYCTRPLTAPPAEAASA